MKLLFSWHLSAFKSEIRHEKHNIQECWSSTSTVGLLPTDCLDLISFYYLRFLYLSIFSKSNDWFYVIFHCSSLVNILIPSRLNLDFFIIFLLLLFVKLIFKAKNPSESRLDFKPGLMFYKPCETLRSLNYWHSWTHNATQHTHTQKRGYGCQRTYLQATSCIN